MRTFDLVVVGLGAMGSAVAYQTAGRTSRVLGIDLYAPPHAYGSSHGDTRITRVAIGEGDAYVPLARRSHELWRELESATGAAVLRPVGLLIMSATSRRIGSHGTADFVAATVGAAQRHGIEHETLATDEITGRFPQFRLESEHRGYFEPGAGFVLADVAVQLQLAEAERRGAEIHRNERVLDLRPGANTVRVTTDRDVYEAAVVVLAVGPWVRSFVEPQIARRFTIYRQVMWWFEIEGDPDLARPPRMPAFIWEFGADQEDLVYGVPAIDGVDGGMKVGTEQYRSGWDPEAALGLVTEAERAGMYERCVRDRILGLGPRAVRRAACLYTVTPDHHFVIDRHPEHPGVVIVAACSGHGFKHSAAIGEAVAQLATGSDPAIDLRAFAFKRSIES